MTYLPIPSIYLYVFIFIFSFMPRLSLLSSKQTNLGGEVVAHNLFIVSPTTIKARARHRACICPKRGIEFACIDASPHKSIPNHLWHRKFSKYASVRNPLAA